MLFGLQNTMLHHHPNNWTPAVGTFSWLSIGSTQQRSDVKD
ncbi:hypothetical protein AHF37_10868 [Paragonimus kellicotti]|nr:hypothetical protein AHF37_10868 [Paragonimus kellicotti]